MDYDLSKLCIIISRHLRFLQCCADKVSNVSILSLGRMKYNSMVALCVWLISMLNKYDLAVQIVLHIKQIEDISYTGVKV